MTLLRNLLYSLRIRDTVRHHNGRDVDGRGLTRLCALTLPRLQSPYSYKTTFDVALMQHVTDVAYMRPLREPPLVETSVQIVQQRRRFVKLRDGQVAGVDL